MDKFGHLSFVIGAEVEKGAAVLLSFASLPLLLSDPVPC